MHESAFSILLLNGEAIAILLIEDLLVIVAEEENEDIINLNLKVITLYSMRISK